MPDSEADATAQLTTPNLLHPNLLTVTKQVCDQLLDARAENSSLDFKLFYDFPKAQAYLSFAKDVAGMSVKGGYLLIGVDSLGVPPQSPINFNLDHYDEAHLGAILNRYLPIRVDLHIAIHPYDFGKVILIYVPPCQDGFLIMKMNGQYQNQAGESVNLFQKGDIFTRHGTSTERILQEDIQEIFARRIAKEREIWRSEVGSQPRAQSLSSGAPEISWQLDLEYFSQMTKTIVRSDDQQSLRELFNSISGLTEHALVDETPSLSITEILDRLVEIAAHSIILDNQEIFKMVVDTLMKVYRKGFNDHSYPRSDTRIIVQVLWYEILFRIYALGGLIVRKGRWEFIKLLVLLGPREIGINGDKNWIRHATTEIARANLLYEFDQAGNRVGEKKLIQLSTDFSDINPILSADVVVGSDETLNSICQFDALVALVALHASNNAGYISFYPHSAHYYSSRVDPVIDLFIDNSDFRTSLGFEDVAGAKESMRAFVTFADEERIRIRMFPEPRTPRVIDWLEG